jgi:hypothetical protein
MRATNDLRSALGDQFVSAVGAIVESISKSPRRVPSIYRRQRRTRTQRFPYAIIFEVQEQRIVVITCFHFKCNPKPMAGTLDWRLNPVICRPIWNDEDLVEPIF